MEYDLMLRSIIKEKKNDDIKYIIYHYDQETKISSLKKIIYDIAGLRFSTFEILENKPNEDVFYDTQKLTAFFASYSKDPEFESEKNIIILWGHGSGLGYFNALKDTSNKVNYFEGVNVKEIPIKDLVLANELINTYFYLSTNLSVDYNLTKFLSESEKNSLRLKPNLRDLISKIIKKYKYISAAKMS
jgi:hypothetical protein